MLWVSSSPSRALDYQKFCCSKLSLMTHNVVVGGKGWRWGPSDSQPWSPWRLMTVNPTISSPSITASVST